MSYQWMFNGSNILGATNAFLTITNVSLANVGVYSVTVTNGFAGATSLDATLTTVDIRMFAGIIVNGVLGTNYTLQSTPSLGGSNWLILTNLSLPGNPYIYIDYSSITNPTRIYRAFTTH